MASVLVIGYGNLDRADDGVAFHVVNALRVRLDQPPLADHQSGLETLSGTVDSLFVRQLVPELMETAAGYRRVVFVDAHVGDGRRELCCETLNPEYAPSPFTHHLTPASFLAMTGALYGRTPEGFIVSVRGRGFDFTRDLSPGTISLVGPATDRVLDLLMNETACVQAPCG